MGLNLQYGLMRILNVSHGEFLMLGAYLTYWAHLVSGVSPFVFLPAVLVVLFALGLVVHRLCFRHLAETTPEVEAFEAKSLLVGFGLMFLVQNVALLIWGADLRGYQYLAQTVSVAGFDLTANRLAAFAGALVLSLGLILLLRATLTGKAVRAMMQSPTGAALVGIDIRRMHPAVFGAGLALAGVAGALLSMVFEISPSMGRALYRDGAHRHHAGRTGQRQRQPAGRPAPGHRRGRRHASHEPFPEDGALLRGLD